MCEYLLGSSHGSSGLSQSERRSHQASKGLGLKLTQHPICFIPLASVKPRASRNSKRGSRFHVQEQVILGGQGADHL